MTDTQVMQDLFDTFEVTNKLNAIVNVENFLAARHALVDLLGPILFGHFIRMRAWQDFTPPVPKLLDTPCRHTRPLPSGKFSLGEFFSAVVIITICRPATPTSISRRKRSV